MSHDRAEFSFCVVELKEVELSARAQLLGVAEPERLTQAGNNWRSNLRLNASHGGAAGPVVLLVTGGPGGSPTRSGLTRSPSLRLQCSESWSFNNFNLNLKPPDRAPGGAAAPA